MTINDVMPGGWNGVGVFSAMVAPPWGNTFSASDLDILYMSHSGEKNIAPLVEYYINDNGKVAEGLSDLARLCLLRFGEQWRKRFTLLNTEYNPMENVNITETATTTGEETNTNSEENTATHSTENTETYTPQLTDTQTVNKSTYGFNSTADTPTDKTTTAAETAGGASTTNSVSGTTTNNATMNGARNKSETANNQIKGLKGVLGQEAALKELSFLKWNFIEDVFKDVDSVLTLKVY